MAQQGHSDALQLINMHDKHACTTGTFRRAVSAYHGLDHLVGLQLVDHALLLRHRWQLEYLLSLYTHAQSQVKTCQSNNNNDSNNTILRRLAF